MKITETKLKGCFIIEPTVFNDDRGYFFESFNTRRFNEAIGQTVHFVQDNQSFSTKGVIRGLHYQTGEHAQAKLVRVLSGTVLDIAVDLRTASPTYGQYMAIELSAENRIQLFIPRGFAHGFSILSETAEFFYKCDNYYDQASEAGIVYNDPSLNIDWQVPKEKIKVLGKDLTWPNIQNVVL